MLALTTALLAAAAVLPLWIRSSGLRGAQRWVAVALSLVAVLAAVVTFATARTPEPPPATRPIEVHDEGYVGSSTCLACHPQQHASWHASFHRTMTQVIGRDALVARFERLQLDWFGEPVLLEWRDERLWTTFRRRGSKPADVHAPIEQITGSHHLQVLWYSTGTGRELAPLPMCYKIEEGIWLPLTAVFVLPPDFRDPPEPGAWSQSCHMCHATRVQPRIDDGYNDTLVTEFGIACEACHGPGAAHAAANRNPLRRYGARLAGDDDTIVEPSSLPPARSAQVCGQCHSVSILRQQHFESWRDEGSPFRPGMDLHGTHLVVGPDDRDAPEMRGELQRNPHFFASNFWPDGEVRVSGREYNGLRASPCFTHGDPARQIDCTSCHSMHGASEGHGESDAAETEKREWRDDQLRGGKRGNTACTQCHEALGDPAALAKHTHHAPGPGSNCYDCHMSHTTFGLMKAMRSHTITSPSVRSELATGRPNACNQCHLDRTLQWTNEHLQAKWGIEPAVLDDEQRTVAAAVRWLLRGDAGQRALAAWSFGWREAQATSGTDWMAPFLARLLDDPYYVVRFQAARALRSLPAGGDPLPGYDFLAAAAVARGSGERVTVAWQQGFAGPPRPAVLIEAAGLRQDVFARLFARRDDRPVYLAE